MRSPMENFLLSVIHNEILWVYHSVIKHFYDLFTVSYNMN
jgi:hypothetical protein